MLDEISTQDWTARLQSLWSQHIPLAHAMGVEVRRLDDAGLQIGAPLAPNRNHIGSAFGGSLQGLATLAGWGVTLVAAGAQCSPGVVIRESRMRFLAPVLGDLLATAAWPDPDTLQEFRARLAAAGRARLVVAVDVSADEDRVAARFCGEFVARLESAAVR